MTAIQRFAVGLLLLAVAYQLHDMAVKYTDAGLSAPYTEADPLPPGMEDMFFGEPSFRAVRKPQNRAMLATARNIEALAGIALLGSAFFILTGIASFRR